VKFSFTGSLSVCHTSVSLITYEMECLYIPFQDLNEICKCSCLNFHEDELILGEIKCNLKSRVDNE
jgi:hypothetical protein